MDQNQTQASPNPEQGAAQANQKFQQGAARANQQYQQYQQGSNQQYQYQQYQQGGPQYQQGGPQYQQQYNQAPPRPNEFQKTVSEVKGAFKNGQGMYSNVGVKLCVIAKIVFWVGVIYKGIECVLGIIGSVSSVGGGLLGLGASVSGVGIVTALLNAAIGVFVFWIASLCIYGFGQIVTKITEDKKEKE